MLTPPDLFHPLFAPPRVALPRPEHGRWYLASNVGNLRPIRILIQYLHLSQTHPANAG